MGTEILAEHLEGVFWCGGMMNKEILFAMPVYVDNFILIHSVSRIVGWAVKPTPVVITFLPVLFHEG